MICNTKCRSWVDFILNWLELVGCFKKIKMGEIVSVVNGVIPVCVHNVSSSDLD